MTERTVTHLPRYLPVPAPAFASVDATPVNIACLLDILAWRRDGDSEGELALIDTYLAPLGIEEDGYGNHFVTIADARGEQPTIAYTAHTDTVHRDLPGQLTDTRQALTLHHDGRTVGVTRGQCLGADDGTGVWLLLNMIEAGVPGLYCFFRDEESGRLGSEWSAKHEPTRYAGVDIMLSFDRAGTTDIITHQMGERCCSEEFALRLAEMLGPEGHMTPDPTGSFTDSYSFVRLIPECTNVSVGYKAQHSKAETQDLTWAAYLANRLIDMDASRLPVARDPAEIDEAVSTIEDMIEAFPDAVAELLETYYGLTPQDLLNDLADYYGVNPSDIEDRVAIDQYMRYPEDTPSDPYDFT